MRRPWKITAVILFALTLLTGFFVGDKLLALSDQARSDIRLYTELVTHAHDRYGTEVTYKDLVFASIQGLLRTLDPHTSFLPPRAYSGMRERQQKSFYGLGILVSMRDGQLTVVTPIEGTPASRLGIRTGDIISTIEGEPTEEMTIDDAIGRLKGPKDTQVNIEIVRRGLDEPLPMAVTRAEIPQTTVRYAHMLDDETGYIWLVDFNRATGEEILDAVAALKEQGMERLIFDLRNNGGGLLDQAIEVSEQFVPTGGGIVEVRGRTADSMQTYKATGRLEKAGIPVVVLVNRGTASAAEIVSGAIQDHDQGLIVGTPTWGKGLVQTVYSLSYGAGMALTTARYYTPSGRLIQRDYTSYYDYVIADSPLPGEDAPPVPPEAKEIFYTDLGREVFGGGGITPDILVDPGEMPLFAQFLLTRNALLNFSVDYLNQNEVKTESWEPKGDLLEEFRSWLLREEVATTEEIEEGLEVEGAADYIRRAVRAEILGTRFGREAQHRVMAGGDPQILKALQVFDQAADLLAQRQSLEQPNQTPRRTAALLQ